MRDDVRISAVGHLRRALKALLLEPHCCGMTLRAALKALLLDTALLRYDIKVSAESPATGYRTSAV